MSSISHNLAIAVVARRLRRNIDEEEEEVKLRILGIGAILFLVAPLLIVPLLYLCIGWCGALVVVVVISVMNWFWIVPMALRFLFLFLRYLFEYLATNFSGIPYSEFDFLGIKGRRYFRNLFNEKE